MGVSIGNKGVNWKLGFSTGNRGVFVVYSLKKGQNPIGNGFPIDPLFCAEWKSFYNNLCKLCNGFVQKKGSKDNYS